MPAIIEHVSDIVLHARGTSRKELFRCALREMNEILKPGSCDGSRHSDFCTRIRVESPDSVTLLAEFLSIILYTSKLQKSLFCYVYFEQLEERRLSARLFGRWHKGLENVIEAVSGAELRRGTNGRWIAKITCEQ